jgi:uncharacterized protein (DUF952 family)
MTADGVYKILTPAQWAALAETGVFAGSAHDRRDGYIHLSTGAQVLGTLEKHYVVAPQVWIAEVNAQAVARSLRWEPSRGGALFPHLYAPLQAWQVRAFRSLRPGPAGWAAMLAEGAA